MKENIYIGESVLKLMQNQIINSKSIYTKIQVSRLIISYIKNNNISKEDLCVKLGVSKKMINSYLSGSRNFNIDELVNIEKKLNVDIFKFDYDGYINSLTNDQNE